MVGHEKKPLGYDLRLTISRVMNDGYRTVAALSCAGAEGGSDGLDFNEDEAKDEIKDDERCSSLEGDEETADN
jgi:hypothetical protein